MSIQENLSRQVGPLKAWHWIVVVIGAYLLYHFFFKSSSGIGGSGLVSDVGSAPGDAIGGGSAGGGGSGSSVLPTTGGTTDNTGNLPTSVNDIIEPIKNPSLLTASPAGTFFGAPLGAPSGTISSEDANAMYDRLIAYIDSLDPNTPNANQALGLGFAPGAPENYMTVSEYKTKVLGIVGPGGHIDINKSYNPQTFGVATQVPAPSTTDANSARLSQLLAANALQKAALERLKKAGKTNTEAYRIDYNSFIAQQQEIKSLTQPVGTTSGH